MIVVDVVVVVVVVVVPLFEFGNHEVANSIALNVRVYSKSEYSLFCTDYWTEDLNNLTLQLFKSR